MRTEEEQYRLICMLILRARAYYYCTGQTVMSDAEYDRMENGLREYEKAKPHLRHPMSPTGLVGSGKLEDYPRSIQREVRRVMEADQLDCDVETIPIDFHSAKKPVFHHDLKELIAAHKEVTGQTMQACNLQMLINDRMIDAQGRPIGA